MTPEQEKVMRDEQAKIMAKGYYTWPEITEKMFAAGLACSVSGGDCLGRGMMNNLIARARLHSWSPIVVELTDALESMLADRVQDQATIAELRAKLEAAERDAAKWRTYMTAPFDGLEIALRYRERENDIVLGNRHLISLAFLRDAEPRCLDKVVISLWQRLKDEIYVAMKEGT